ncbi:metallophosphoesterase [Saccharomonospora azurea]|uniref:Calcineurin-like phosphoesterase n=1 Tax=Saccharomonospora azurea NA-128 TaxID=882081 RepID=H8G3R9_9PSEU|nr:metallophosphoesterase [Saccharomonospora azurea]EHK87663.1 Calcineurin-like phosphoesterase [Saccharomonospora azurea SZMC 14600]EHY89087.1 Calcineurin-like phosphoesterase [Saccharomonospora azurea NA-128]
MKDHPTFVVGDVHGHRDELAEALQDAGLVDDNDNWTGADAHLWFLGDFVDRGPDGVGAIDLVRSLQRQAPEAGGFVDSLLGNHEILLLGMHRYGDTLVPVDAAGGPGRSFERSWAVNGGQPSDQKALTDEHVEWLTSRRVAAVVADHLLVHSDTLEYLDWGDTVEEVNDAVRAILTGDDLGQWWDVWRRMTTRFAFRGPEGVEAANELLQQLGGERVVHGHSVIADQVGVHPVELDAPHLYAGGKALGIDAGLFAGGPCLVVELPYEPTDETDADTVSERD